MIGPWEAQIEASLSGTDSALRVVVPALRLTVDLDQPLPLEGAGASTAGPAANAAGNPAPSIDFPPIVKSLRVDGGELVLKHGGQTQTVGWRAEFSQVSAGAWRGTFVAMGEGIELNATVTYEAEKRTWKVPALAARIDLARWSALVPPGLWPKNEAWTCTGTANLEAAITWAPDGLEGMAATVLHEGTATSSDGTISAVGIEAAVRLVSLARPASAPDQHITVQTLTAGKVALTNLALGITVFARNRIAVQLAAEAFGGKLRVEPFEFDPAAPNVRLTVVMDGVNAQGVLALFPDAPQGQGTLVGQIPLSYEHGQLGFGEGRLDLRRGTTGRVRFQNPGLFTQAWHWFMPGRKMMSRIETGQEDLLVNELSIAVHPDDSGAEHGAEIRVTGVPADHPKQGPYIFEFYINAPLENFMNLGMKQNLQFGSR